ncbi:hypothetical protein [Cryptosporangium arvum]|uniref:hypothetical protein n=1 Tax=Cryptosporangium arvum TaxID=80871 RepID=UPI0004ACAD75|nr:hypothetical protein [Cryptosporangium arvum]
MTPALVGNCVVVYDRGAGTFDVSVVRREPDGYQTLSCRGADDPDGVSGVNGPDSVAIPWDQLDRIAIVASANHSVVVHPHQGVEPSAEPWYTFAGPDGGIPLADLVSMGVSDEEFEAATRRFAPRAVPVERSGRGQRLDRSGP